jgi:hypothetical protein
MMQLSRAVRFQAPIRHALYKTSPAGCSFSSYSPLEWWKNRQESQEAEKYKKRIQYMASKDAWTVGDMKEELDELMSSWTAKLSDSKEVRQGKDMHKTVSGIIAVVGDDATDVELENMSRTDKLKASIQGETSVEDINMFARQFQTMALMHRVLRKRKEEGKSLPQTVESMQTVIQAEGAKLLSKNQRNRMMKKKRN